MDSSLRTIALADRSGQIEGPIFARQKGNKLTLRTGRGQEDRSMPLGRYSDDDTSPPSPGRPSAALADPPPRPPRPLYQRQPVRVLRITPALVLRPFCFPFPKSASRQRPRGSVSRLIKRRKLPNEISIRLGETRSSVSSPAADRLISQIPSSSSSSFSSTSY